MQNSTNRFLIVGSYAKVRRIIYFSGLPSADKKLIMQEMEDGFTEPFGVNHKGERYRAIQIELNEDDCLVLLDYVPSSSSLIVDDRSKSSEDDSDDDEDDLDDDDLDDDELGDDDIDEDFEDEDEDSDDDDD